MIDKLPCLGGDPAVDWALPQGGGVPRPTAAPCIQRQAVFMGCGGGIWGIGASVVGTTLNPPPPPSPPSA